jgi:hypothetical protein
MLRLALAEYRLDRLSSGEQTGRACHKSAAVIASQSSWQQDQHGCNQDKKGQDEMFEPLGTKVTAACWLPHAKAITGKIC